MSEIGSVSKRKKPNRKKIMLISGPVIRVGKPKSWPIGTPFEENIEFLGKLFFASKKLDESFGIMRSIEAVMPSISFNVVVGKDVGPFLFG